MDLLVDTQVFLQWIRQDAALSGAVAAALADRRNRVFVSAASVWEIAIKRALGKLAFTHPIEPAIEANGFTPLAIEARHAERAGGLPPHHRDPFDRLLIAQALDLGLVLATRDPALAPYGAATIGLG